MGKIVKIIFVLSIALGLANAALTLDNESELRESQAALFNENSESAWILLNYNSPSTVHFAAGGEGGVSDILPNLEDNQIQYILLRIGGIQEKGSLKATTRDVFIVWIGPNVDANEKRRKTAHLGDAESLLQVSPAMNTVTKNLYGEDDPMKSMLFDLCVYKCRICKYHIMTKKKPVV